MTPQVFQKLKSDLDNHRNPQLNVKADEYSSDTDRMWNFKFVAQVITLWLQLKTGRNDLTVSEAEAALFLDLKHLASIVKILADNKPVPIPVLNEKFGDNGNYNDIIYSLLAEYNQVNNCCKDENTACTC